MKGVDGTSRTPARAPASAPTRYPLAPADPAGGDPPGTGYRPAAAGHLPVPPRRRGRVQAVAPPLVGDGRHPVPPPDRPDRVARRDRPHRPAGRQLRMKMA